MTEGVSNQTLARELLALWPKYLTYFNSFASVLLMWMAHHKLFRMLRTSSPPLMLANGLLLLLIALVPFPTKTLGEFIVTDARQTAVIFFTSYSALVGIGFLLLSYTAGIKKYSMIMPGKEIAVAALRRSQWVGVGAYIATTVLAFFAPIVAVVITFCMWAFWALMARD